MSEATERPSDYREWIQKHVTQRVFPDDSEFRLSQADVLTWSQFQVIVHGFYTRWVDIVYRGMTRIAPGNRFPVSPDHVISMYGRPHSGALHESHWKGGYGVPLKKRTGQDEITQFGPVPAGPVEYPHFELQALGIMPTAPEASEELEEGGVSEAAFNDSLTGEFNSALIAGVPNPILQAILLRMLLEEAAATVKPVTPPPVLVPPQVLPPEPMRVPNIKGPVVITIFLAVVGYWIYRQIPKWQTGTEFLANEAVNPDEDAQQEPATRKARAKAVRKNQCAECLARCDATAREMVDKIIPDLQKGWGFGSDPKARRKCCNKNSRRN